MDSLLIHTLHSLAKDQTEINRIIAEASKGSKFYDVSVEGDLTRLTTLILYYILE